jgi:hypothetical protein
LQPENVRERTACRHALIELETDDMRPVSRGDISAEHVVEAAPRVGLFAEIVQRGRRQSVATQLVGRITFLVGDGAVRPREFEGRPIISDINAIDGQAPERPQLVLAVAGALGI